MAWSKFKWKDTILFYFIVVNTCVKSFPITDNSLAKLVTTDTFFTNLEVPVIQTLIPDIKNETAQSNRTVDFSTTDNTTETTTGKRDVNTNQTSVLFKQNVRPGQEMRQYAVQITINGDNFNGRAVIDVRLEFSTREDPIILHVEDMNIQSVSAGIFTESNIAPADFSVDDGILEITPSVVASSYVIVIEYNGPIRNDGTGIFRGNFNDNTYLGMNLYPTNARRVFPCVDELLEASTISFTFNNVEYVNMFANSIREEDNPNQFRSLQGTTHRWGMIAHNFNSLNSIPTQGGNVILYGRSVLANQASQANIAINAFFNILNEWTNKPYFEIDTNQDGRMNIVALPDTDRDWYALSTVCIWEPYVFMENVHSSKQKLEAFTEISKALSRQWFGYVIYPENWRYSWITTGLGDYAAYDIMKTFQTSAIGEDVTLLDMDTIFVTDVIQESMYYDGYASAAPLEPAEDLFDEQPIRDLINGLVKQKSVAILHMLRLVLDRNEDYVKIAAQLLLNVRSLQTVNSFNFYDAVISNWLASGSQNMISDVGEFLEPWILDNGYPVINVFIRQGGLLVNHERFGYSEKEHRNYLIPLTYTTSTNFNFDDVFPQSMMDGAFTINIALGEEDFPLFNIQGQGYYRVNYDLDLWERIIEGLNNPDIRNLIHPTNRATLVDDALNLARAGKLSYDIAFRVVLAMEHEMEYAPWKAFIRNMDFIRKRLVALVEDDEDLDPDIYLRMVRRTIGTVENELGFNPDPQIIEPAMHSLTRGIVMDHACRAKYAPCIAAAIDWFFDYSGAEPVVNPNIPHDLRPAVYCSMVREGGDDIIAALYERLAIEPTAYERVVILESLGCSADDVFIRTLLEETIAGNSPYGVEERSRIFKGVVAGSFVNAGLANMFLAQRVNEVRNMYGGAEKLEEIIFYLAEHAANNGLTDDFGTWINAGDSSLGDSSQENAQRARRQALENREWIANHVNIVYDWIDENDAPSLVGSLLLLSCSLLIGFLNN